MALRLRAMRRVLKDTGSIYLHCDPTASHYLKLLLDAIYGRKNFRNEIVWKRTVTVKGDPSRRLANDTDYIFFYSMTGAYEWNVDAITIPYDLDNLDEKTLSQYKNKDASGRLFQLTSITDPRQNSSSNCHYELFGVTRTWRYTRENMQKLIEAGRIIQTKPGNVPRFKRYLDEQSGRKLNNLWTDIPNLTGSNSERLGYPTQKPLALMNRIIKASSNEGDTVLDPFCGCGTTVHAAESLGRQWIGIDISKFSTGLIRDRILHNFKYLNGDDIDLRGTPDSVGEARKLARSDPFEFEKWVCGYIGAEGMFREPGERGADGGVDGVLKFFPVREGKKVKPEYAIVQVKGGNVSSDAVKALHETVRRYEATAGVMVCFSDQLGTVENQRIKATFSDAWGSYPVIQGFSVESLLGDEQLDLPLYGYKRRGAMLGL